MALPLPNFPRNTHVYVAFSGGVDSTAALLWSKQNFDSVTAIHFNHGWEASNLIEAHVRNQLPKFGVPTLFGKAQAPCLTETLAREARYNYFREVLPKEAVLILGHNQEEQLETILFQISRGTSKIPGMQTVTPQDYNELQFYRPFLEVSKKELQDFCSAESVTWFEDPSNSDTNYARNKIRHELLPLLASLNQNSLQHWTRFFSDLQAQAEIPNYPAKWLAESVHSVHELKSLPEAAIRQFLHAWLSPKLPSLNHYHITQCLRVINGINPKTQLPNKVFFARSMGKVRLVYPNEISTS